MTFLDSPFFLSDCRRLALLRIASAQIVRWRGKRHRRSESTRPTNVWSDTYGNYTQVGPHEMGHTYQYQLLGPLFLPVYLMSGGVSANNPWEQAADNYALGGNWFPQKDEDDEDE